MKFLSRHGLPLTLIARAAGSDNSRTGIHDSVWAMRSPEADIKLFRVDGMRCYYLHDIRSEGGSVEIADFATTLPVMDKAEASAKAMSLVNAGN